MQLFGRAGFDARITILVAKAGDVDLAYGVVAQKKDVITAGLYGPQAAATERGYLTQQKSEIPVSLFNPIVR